MQEARNEAEVGLGLEITQGLLFEGGGVVEEKIEAVLKGKFESVNIIYRFLQVWMLIVALIMVDY